MQEEKAMYKLCFYVPLPDCDRVKQAVFDAGAGRIGNYDACCWQVAGRGQFRPLAGSQPHIGERDELETVEEYRVEMVCDDDVVEAAVKALKRAHPYEEPAYDVWKLADL
jgi:hypothetical protein